MTDDEALSDAELIRMNKWIAAHGHDPRVRRWIENNPPPDGWRWSLERWAYVEMPFFDYGKADK